MNKTQKDFYGNPSSVHTAGRKQNQLLKDLDLKLPLLLMQILNKFFLQVVGQNQIIKFYGQC